MRTTVLSEKKFLRLPVLHGAPKIKITLLNCSTQQEWMHFEIELGSWDHYDFISCTASPVSDGESLLVEAEQEIEFRFSDRYEPAIPNLELELARPCWHFSARQGWINDPNGLFHWNGLWHLFFQHNPWGRDWGNMSWGHAVSKDLLHWEERSDVLFPDTHGAMFSGCAVIDTENCSKLGDGITPPILLFYTADRQPDATQCMAYSRDGGESFVKYEQNPILPTRLDARDPSVFFDRKHQQWVMALYEGDRAGGSFAIYHSRNLLQWEAAPSPSFRFGRERECPGFFPLQLQNSNQEAEAPQYVFWGANGFYLLGDWDGELFSFDPEAIHRWLYRDGSGSAYAPQAWFSSGEAQEERKVAIAWQYGDRSSNIFNQSMTLPVELTLQRFAEGVRLTSRPAAELETLRVETWQTSQWEVGVDDARHAHSFAMQSEAWDVSLELDWEHLITMTLSGVDIALDGPGREIRVGSQALKLPADASNQVRILTDRGSVELFAADGRMFLAKRVATRPVAQPVYFEYQCAGEGTLRNLRISRLEL